MALIYHVTTISVWKASQQKGSYEPASLVSEGFIHCSEKRQVAGVLERYFTGQDGLVKLVIDTDKLTSKYIFESSPSVADSFPHVYGPINVDAVTDVIAL